MGPSAHVAQPIGARRPPRPPEVPTSAKGWLLLIHQIPVRPIYLRARIGMRLTRLGAVALKNSVYALPVSDGAPDGLRQVAKEIRDGGGRAFVCDARFAPRHAEPPGAAARPPPHGEDAQRPRAAP